MRVAGSTYSTEHVAAVGAFVKDKSQPVLPAAEVKPVVSCRVFTMPVAASEG